MLLFLLPVCTPYAAPWRDDCFLVRWDGIYLVVCCLHGVNILQVQNAFLVSTCTSSGQPVAQRERPHPVHRAARILALQYIACATEIGNAPMFCGGQPPDEHGWPYVLCGASGTDGAGRPVCETMQRRQWPVVHTQGTSCVIVVEGGWLYVKVHAVLADPGLLGRGMCFIHLVPSARTGSGLRDAVYTPGAKRSHEC